LPRAWVALDICQLAECISQLVGDQPIESLFFDVTTARVSDRFGQRRHLGSTLSPASRIEQASMGDDEHPRTEGGLIAVKRLDVACDLKEGLGSQVLGIDGPSAGEIAGDGTGQLSIKVGPGPLLSRLGGGEPVREVVRGTFQVSLWRRRHV
jgi:hypothetical protein